MSRETTRRLCVALMMVAGCVGHARAQSAVRHPDSAAVQVLHISLEARTLWAISSGGDTLLTAAVAVGSGKTLRSDGRTWRFRTPVGDTRVTEKQVRPLWVPPDWYYIELARDRKLRVHQLEASSPYQLSDGRALLVRDGTVGVLGRDGVFRAAPPGVDVILDGIVFIPPLGTSQRRLPGVLGPFRLMLANGVGLHGTLDKASIGQAVTHGCIRLHDADITWLYDRVPIGTAVRIR